MFPTTLRLSYTGPLNALLDTISARMGVTWEFVNGKIVIYRFATKTFTLVASPGSTSFSSSLGRAGSISTGGGSGAGGGSVGGSLSAAMTLVSQANIDVWDSIEKTVRSILSPVGRVTINQMTGSITVTDVPTIVNQVGELIANENAIMNRQVALQVDVFTVRSREGTNFGADWNLIWSKLSSGVRDFTFALGSPSSLVNSATTGAIGVTIVRPLPVAGSNNVVMDTGSSAVYRALNEIAKVNVVTQQRAVTINRRPVPLAITSQVAYLAETVPAQSSVTGSGTPGLKAGSVTTGFLMNLFPTITDNNAILLSFSLDMSDLLKLQTITSGQGDSQQSIQAPEVSGMQFLQHAALKTGETLILTGFERNSGQFDKRGLARDVEPGMAGSLAGHDQRESMIVMITPVIIEGI
jgi:type IVB pilus formation R64 PilN family outer membrane protein